MSISNSNAENMHNSQHDGKPMLPAVYRHKLTGNVGTYVKEYKPTARPLTMQIKLADGRIYYAPKHEFELVKNRS